MDWQIEEWSKDGLIPSPDAPIDFVVAWARALDTLGYGPGKSADDTALRLLSMGIGVERARYVLADRANPLTRLGDFDGTLPAETLDVLRSDTGLMAFLAPVMGQIFSAISDVPESGREDYAGVPLDETPADREERFLGAMRGLLSGDPVPDSVPELMVDMIDSPVGPFGPDPKHRARGVMPNEIEAAEMVIDRLGAAMRSIPAIIADTPLSVLAAAAVIGRDMLAAFSAPGFDDRHRDVLAAYMAPIVVSMAGLGVGPGPGPLGSGDTETETP